jgi:GTP-binding protein
MKRRSIVVSLIGRPNVGKSTIFNRLMKKSFKAMTFDQPGVTRDRHYGIATMESITGEEKEDLIVVDTGGFYPDKVEEVKSLGKKKTAEPFFNIMAEHAKLAIDESDLVLFVVDVREGLIPFDKSICDYIRTRKKPVWLLVNKFDSDKQWGDEAEFYELGLADEEFMIVSAEHGRGLQLLSERLFDFAKEFQTNDELDVQRGVKPNHDVAAYVSIIGAPNAGKSTLLNQFVGSNRALVSDIAGTTVDPIEGYFELDFGKDANGLSAMEDQFRKTNKDLMEELAEFEDEYAEVEMLAYNEMPEQYKQGQGDFDDIDDSDEEFEFSEENIPEDMFTIEDNEAAIEMGMSDDTDDDVLEVETEVTPESTFRSVKLVDTAGIRKQKNVAGFIEEQSVYRSLKAISESDVIIYMIDATLGITHQDRRLCDIALDKGKSIIICLNKVDLLPEVMGDAKRKREWLADLRDSIPWLSFCELITISAKKGKHLGQLKKSLKKTIIIRSRTVTTGKLNKIVSFLVDKFPVVLKSKSGGGRLKVKYASMIKSAPPTILLFANKSQGVPVNYRRYLTNAIRKEFNMVNTPIHLIFRTTTDIERRMKKTNV